jgi:hypothetical protein
MKRPPRELDDGRKYFSPVFASVCVFAALALVLVTFRLGTKQSPTSRGYHLENIPDVSLFDFERGIAIRLSNGSRSMFQKPDESDAAEFQIDDFVLRAESIPAGGAGNVTVLLLINNDTPAGDLVATIDQLRAVGVQSFEVVSDDNDRK